MEDSAGLAHVMLPESPGTYAILLQLESAQAIRVGRLGDFDFPAGYYLYLGSALGPGGLTGRLGRHLAWEGAQRRPHWHIDYFRQHASVQAIWYITDKTRREHDWAELAARLDGASTPAPRFGASDCRCPSHLYHFETAPDPLAFHQLLRQHYPADPPLRAI